MHENHFEALKLVQELAALLRANSMPEGREVSVHAPYTSLRTVQTALETDHVPVALGAQSCHFEDAGAFTGEVSAEMLAKLNVSYVIAGHSERRQLFSESDEIVRKKIDAILRHGMCPIICVGETLEERSGGEEKEKVARQLHAALDGRSHEVIAHVVLAYEPIWAIGTGVTATVADAEEMCAYIRQELEAIGGAAASSTRIQYGGSVNVDNAEQLLMGNNIDGLLVGGASLDATGFMKIARAGL